MYLYINQKKLGSNSGYHIFNKLLINCMESFYIYLPGLFRPIKNKSIH